MSLVKVKADGGLISAAATGSNLSEQLQSALAPLPAGAPVVVMIHGFNFSPDHPIASPFDHILSFNPERDSWKARSWPRMLGIYGDGAHPGLSIALGWKARGSIWQAYRRAGEAGLALAELVRLLRRLRPGLQVDVVAHSLGARVALSALPYLPENGLRRAVLMSAAEFSPTADLLMASPAAATAEFLNVTSRENDLYDWLLERIVAPTQPSARALSTGLQEERENWCDLQIDQQASLATLGHLGFPIAAPEKRVCHWSTYLRDGVFPIYRAFIIGDLPLEILKSRLPRSRSARWSRLFEAPRPNFQLPLSGNAPS